MIASLHLTRDCNFRCDYCYAGNKVRDHMSPEVLHRAVELVFHHDADSLAGFRFFGGEPLLCFDLIQKGVALASKHRLSGQKEVGFAVSTNGWLLTRKHCRFFARHEFELGISLDGIPEAHDRHRHHVDGGPTALRTLDAVRMAMAIVPATVVLMTLSPDTVHTLSESLRFLYDHGVRNVRALPNILTDWPRSSFEAYGRELAEAGRFHYEKMQTHDPIFFDRIDKNLMVLFGGGYDCFTCCSLGSTECGIAPSGHIYACERLVGNDDTAEFRIGHVDTGIDPGRVRGLEAARERGDPKCRECELNTRCVNWCGCANRAVTGQWNTVPDVLCEFQKVELPYVEQAARRLLTNPSPTFLDKFGPSLEGSAFAPSS